MKKRIFSWLLCAAMLLSLMPTGIFALAEDVAAEAADIVIENYDSTSGAVWGASGGSDIADFVEGEGALTASAAAGAMAYINTEGKYNIPLPEDYTDWYIDFWIYVSDPTSISAGSNLEISHTVDKAEFSFALLDMGLKAGWNKVQKKLYVPAVSEGYEFTHIKNIRCFAPGLKGDLVMKLDNLVLTKTPVATDRAVLDDVIAEAQAYVAAGSDDAGVKAALALAKMGVSQADVAALTAKLKNALIAAEAASGEAVGYRSYTVLEELGDFADMREQTPTTRDFAYQKTFNAIDLTQYGYPAEGKIEAGKLALQFDTYIAGDNALVDAIVGKQNVGQLEITSSGKADVEENAVSSNEVKIQKGQWTRSTVDLAAFNGSLNPAAWNFMRLYYLVPAEALGGTMTLSINNVRLVDLTKPLAAGEADRVGSTLFKGIAQATTVHGRTPQDASGNLRLFWTNSGFSFRFYGTAASVKLSGTEIGDVNRGYVNVYVDGALMPHKTIAVNSTDGEWYELVADLPLGEHTVEVRKRNEAVYGGSATVTVRGVKVVGGPLLKAPAEADYQIEFIGDSITSGFGNLVDNGSGDYTSATVEGTMTWAALAAKQLGAEAQVISRSGIGFCRNTLIHNNIDSSIYPYYTQTAALPGTTLDGTAWDFESNPSDVVVINLGTNDGGGTIDGVAITDAFMASEAVALLQLVRENNPDAVIIWTYGLMGNGREAALSAAVAQVNAAGDDKVYYLPMAQFVAGSEGTGTHGHPSVQAHINRSRIVADFIAEKTGRAVNNRAMLEAQLRWSEQYNNDEYLTGYIFAGVAAFKNAMADGAALLQKSNADNAAYVAAANAIWNAKASLKKAEKNYQSLAELPYSFDYTDRVVDAGGGLMAHSATFDPIDLTAYGYPATGLPEAGKLALQFDVYLDGDSALADAFATGAIVGSFEMTSGGACDVEERNRHFNEIPWSKGVWVRHQVDLATFSGTTGGTFDPTAFDYVRIYIVGLTSYAGQKVTIALKNMSIVDLTQEETLECTHESIVYTGKIEPTLEKEGFTGNGYCAKCGLLMTEGEAIPKLTAYAKLDFASGELVGTSATASNYVLEQIPGTDWYGAKLNKQNQTVSFALDAAKFGIEEADILDGTDLAIAYEYYVTSAWGNDHRLAMFGNGYTLGINGGGVNNVWDCLPVNVGTPLSRGQLNTVTFTVGAGSDIVAAYNGNIGNATTAVAGEAYSTLSNAQALVSGGTFTLYCWNNDDAAESGRAIYLKSITVCAADELATSTVEEGSEAIFFDIAENPYYPQYAATISKGLTMSTELVEWYPEDAEQAYPRFNYGYVKVNKLLSADGVTPKDYLLRITAKAGSDITQIRVQYQKAKSNTAEIEGDERWSAYYILTFADGMATLRMDDTVLCNGLNGASSIRLQDIHYVQSGDTYVLQTDDDLADIASIEVIPVPCTHETTKIEGAIDATCGADGYTGNTVCANCGELIAEGEVIPATGEHAWDDGVETIAPTYESAGEMTYTCTVCGEFYTEEIPVLEACTHEETTITGKVDATCTTDGYTGDTVCAACGEVITAGEVIKAGHVFGDDTVCDICGED
ncbi:MAG: hypothetical protein E7549_08585, partial [Ruminococcaceae bacterium]|nr:hypothetical protein [Oscillospiraceae bacterium]